MTSGAFGGMAPEQLAAALGSGILRNTIRENHVTCDVCTTPSSGYERCLRCYEDANSASTGGHRHAELVVPLAYAVKGSQSGHMMHCYKWRQNPVLPVRKQLALRLLVALRLHRRCIETMVHAPIAAWTTVPSSWDRGGPHPLAAVAAAAAPPGHEITLERGRGFIQEDRSFEPRRWAVREHDAVAGRHVLVIDDTWTSGARVQSAAMALAAAGAVAVTVLVLARWLDPDYRQSSAFVKDRLPNEPAYDPAVCPVTGRVCQPAND